MLLQRYYKQQASRFVFSKKQNYLPPHRYNVMTSGLSSH
jgi:hypothetical protein